METPIIRERMVGLLAHVDKDLAGRVAAVLGISVAAAQKEAAKQVALAKQAVNEAESEETQAKKRASVMKSSALSMANTIKEGIKSRKVAVLAADGVDVREVQAMKAALEAEGVVVKILAPYLGELKSESGKALPIDHTILTMPSVAFDAVFIPGGEDSIAVLKGDGAAMHFIREAYKHCKTIALSSEALSLMPVTQSVAGIIVMDQKAGNKSAKAFIEAIAQHRHWSRDDINTIAA